jgi:hypothetical protein
MPGYQTIFRGRTRMARANHALEGQRNTTVLEYVGHKGSFRATTVAGQITGHGLSLGVIDDPIKGRAEASSKTIRDKTWNWLVDDFFSRFADHAGLLMICTRWHVDDPLGRWLEKFPETKVLSYEAVATEDDWSVIERRRRAGAALFPELKPLDFLLERKRLSTTSSWESLYQQKPIIAGGGIFPIEKFTYVNAVDRANIKKSVRYIDKAGTEDGGAYTAMACAGFGRLCCARTGEGLIFNQNIQRCRRKTTGRRRKPSEAAAAQALAASPVLETRYPKT